MFGSRGSSSHPRPTHGARITLTLLVLASASAAALPLAAHAQAWNGLGIALVEGPTRGRPWTMLPAPAGGLYVTFSRLGRLNVSRYASDGTRADGWPAGGIEVCPTSLQPFFVAADDGAGGLLLAWEDQRIRDERRMDSSVQVQRLLADGTTAWPDTGVFVSSSWSLYAPLTMSDGAGGAFVVALNYHSLDTLRAFHVLAAGTLDPTWPADGCIVCASGDSPGLWSLISDAAGGLMVFWHDYRFGSADIFAQRIGADGAIASGWPAYGAPVTTAPGGQFYPLAMPDGAGGALVVWGDERHEMDRDIYAQHITATGALAAGWPAGGRAVCAAPFDQLSPVAVSDGAGGAYVAWDDQRNDANDVYVVRIDGDGAPRPGWPADGAPACSLLADQQQVAIARDASGGVILAWRDGRSVVDKDIYAVGFTADGALAPGWIANGKAVSALTGLQERPAVVSDSAGGAFVVWRDYRVDLSGGDLYGGHIAAGGVVATEASLVSSQADPSSVRLVWSVASAAPLVVQRASADAWTMIATCIPDGDGRVRFEDAGVTAGARVGYRLTTSGGAALAGSEVWLDVPRVAAPALALTGFVPNPAAGVPVVEFALPGDGPATLEVFDPAGRRVARETLAQPAPGRHRLRVSGIALPAGAYVVRLTQGGTTRVTRGAIVR
jgi:hypothetical protein